MLLSTALYLMLLLQSVTASETKCKDENTRQVITEFRSKFDQIETKLDFIMEVVTRNDTDDLEERVQILELEMDNVEHNLGILENQDSILEVRINDIDEDIADLNSNVTDLINVDSALDDRISNLEDVINAPWIACESSPCDNVATCVDVNVDTFICLCRDGFFGPTCSNSYADAAFLATVGAENVSPVPNPIVFNETRLNPGGHYDNTTGIYTAPYDALYQFNVNIRANPDNDFGFYLLSDGIEIVHARNADVGGPGLLSAGFLITVHAYAGQEFWVRPADLEVMHGRSDDERGYLNSWFAGHVLSVD